MGGDCIWLEKTVLKVKTDNLLLKKNGKVTKDW